MNINPNECKTWRDVLIEKGFDSSTANALVGFISWNKGEEFTHLGNEITEVLANHNGKVYTKDVISTNYNDKGLLFFSSKISDEVANEVFETIMGYEQNNVYNTLY